MSAEPFAPSYAAAPQVSDIHMGHPERQPAHGWEEPIPLGNPAPPAFPVHILAGTLGLMVHAVTVEQQVPPDLSALLAFGTLSAAVAGRIQLQVHDGWREPALLWTAPVLPPGQSKSPTLRRLRQPLDEAERRLQQEAAGPVSERRAQREIAEKRARKLAEKAANSIDPAAQAEALDARVKYEQLDELHSPRLTTGDATPEALIRLLVEQRGRLALLDAEGGTFGTIAGRYTGMAKVDEVNKSYDCEPIRVDRVGRAPLSVDRPALTLCLAVQPDVIREASGQRALRDRGLLDRFTYAVPTPTVGRRTEMSPAVVAESVLTCWATLVNKLVDLGDDPVTLRLSSKAWQLHAEWRRQLEPRLLPSEGDLAVIGGWAAKHAGRVARIAALLHLAAHPSLDQREVDVDTMTAALTIGDWAIPHALVAFDLAAARPDLAPARSVLHWAQKAGVAQFTLREAHQAVKGQRWVTGADAVRAAVTVLVDHGWVHPLPFAGDRPGRPSERYVLYPHSVVLPVSRAIWDA